MRRTFLHVEDSIENSLMGQGGGGFAAYAKIACVAVPIIFYCITGSRYVRMMIFVGGVGVEVGLRCTRES